MKTIVIRECAVKALRKMGTRGADLLLRICEEALTGDPIDFSKSFPYSIDDARAMYEAVAPDIIASVEEEESPIDIAHSVAEALVEELAMAYDAMCGQEGGAKPVATMIKPESDER